jgi:hypothetical protein
MNMDNQRNRELYNDPYMQEAIIIVNEQRELRKKKKPKENTKNREFLLKRRTLSDFLPAGNEDISLITIFTLVPYLTGMVFVFFVIAEASFTKLISLSKYHSFPLIWAIGYEIVAGLLLLWFFKIIIYAIFEGKEEDKPKTKKRRR